MIHVCFTTAFQLLRLSHYSLRNKAQYHKDVPDASEEPKDDEYLVHGKQRTELVLLGRLERGGIVAKSDRRQRDERVVHRHVVRPLLKVREDARRRKDEHDHTRYQVQHDLPDEADAPRCVSGVGG